MIIKKEEYRGIPLYYISESCYEEYDYACTHNVGICDTADANIPEDRQKIVFYNRRYVDYAEYASSSLGFVRKLKMRDDGQPCIDDHGDMVYECLRGDVVIFKIEEDV
jgi:hypothetical protein